MRCHEAQELLSAYLDGMLDPSEKERVDRHLGVCQVCRSDLNDFEMVLGLVRDLPPVAPPPEFRLEVRRKIEQSSQGCKAGFWSLLARGRWSGLVAVAASFALVVGLAAAWQGLPWRGETATDQMLGGLENGAVNKTQVQEEYHLGSGESRILADGLAGNQMAAPETVRIQTQSMAVQEPEPEKKAVAAETKMPVSLKAEDTVAAPLKREKSSIADSASVQERKLSATGNGNNGVPARGASVAPPSVTEELVQQAAIEVRVQDRASAVRTLLELALKVGGAASVLPETGGREIVLQVPGDQFERAVAEIAKTGRIIRQDYLPGTKSTAAGGEALFQAAGAAPATGVGITGLGGGDPQPAPAPGTAVPPVGKQPEVKKEKPPDQVVKNPLATIRIKLE